MQILLNLCINQHIIGNFANSRKKKEEMEKSLEELQLFTGKLQMIMNEKRFVDTGN